MLIAVNRSLEIINQFRKPILLSLLIILYLFSSVVKTQGKEPTRLVIGVAEWRHASGPGVLVQSNTYNQLLDKLMSLDQDEFEVVLIPTFLETAREVDQVTSQFGVDIIVWGWYDEIAVRGYVDLANATEENGMTNSLAAYLENNGNPLAIRVLKVLSEFDYYEDGVTFCVPRWTP